MLFDESIKNNILYGKDNASFEEICDAISNANIEDFILSNQANNEPVEKFHTLIRKFYENKDELKEEIGQVKFDDI